MASDRAGTAAPADFYVRLIRRMLHLRGVAPRICDNLGAKATIRQV